MSSTESKLDADDVKDVIRRYFEQSKEGLNLPIAFARLSNIIEFTMDLKDGEALEDSGDDRNA